MDGYNTDTSALLSILHALSSKISTCLPEILAIEEQNKPSQDISSEHGEVDEMDIKPHEYELLLAKVISDKRINV